MRGRIRISVQLLTTLQHRHKVGYPLAACFCFFGGGDAEEETVALGFVKCVEESLGIGFSRQSGEKILWHLGGADAVVGGCPAAVGFGSSDGSDSSGLHSACFFKPCHVPDVDLRSDTALASFGELLQKGRVIKGFLLAVYPAKTKRLVQCFRIGHSGDAAGFFGNL